MKIYDVTVAIGEGVPIYEGDPPAVVRDAERNRLIMIPAYEMLISDEQRAELVGAGAGHP